MENITPRTNAPFLAQHTNHTIILVGRVSHLPSSSSAVIDAAGSVNVALGPGMAARAAPGSVVQVIGRVGPDLGVKALSVLELGGSVDLNLYNTLVEASHSPALRQLFMH